MIYIDKSKNKIEGEQVTKDYLQNCCVDPSTGKYLNILYDKRDGHGLHFSTADSCHYRQRMKSILHSNQSGFCCYCLRELRVDEDHNSLERISIEHIIPRGYDSTNCSDLPIYRMAPGLSEHEIELRKEFENKNTQSFPPYPHNIAYGNLVASCKGVFPDDNNGNTPICCNLARGDKQAYPAYFHNDIQNFVKYGADGSIVADSRYHHYDLLRKMIVSTKLFKRPLKDIRRLWYELRHCSLSDIQNCATENERHIIMSKYIYGMSFADKKYYINKYKKDIHWHTFILYKKFHSIMRQQHP